MSQNFDEFSKHMAAKQSRRGILKLLGGGVLGIVTGAVFTRSTADAGSPRGTSHKLPQGSPFPRPPRIVFNGTTTDK